MMVKTTMAEYNPKPPGMKNRMAEAIMPAKISPNWSLLPLIERDRLFAINAWVINKTRTTAPVCAG